MRLAFRKADRGEGREIPDGPFAAAAAAEGHYRRMWRLRRMDAGELRRLLAGEACDVAPWIESAARYGLVEAQLRLGQMLLDGAGVAADPAAALRWFLQAAGHGAPEAMNMAGRCYENGWGAPVDLAAAADWYRRSADAGCDWGEYNYANMLFDGRGVACDQARAVRLYGRAAGQGHARAMNLLARCYEEGWGVGRDPALARDWYRRSAEGGYFRAQYNLATILAGRGEIEAAADWFETACRAATAAPESLRAMVRAFAEQDEPRLSACARRIAQSLCVAP